MVNYYVVLLTGVMSFIGINCKQLFPFLTTYHLFVFCVGSDLVELLNVLMYIISWIVDVSLSRRAYKMPIAGPY